jgi:serine/threonine protein kinase
MGFDDMYLFTEKIDDWGMWWGKIFQSIPAFEPLVKFIFEKEKLPFAKMETLKPGTNAVFKVGEYVIKIFVPQGLAYDYGTSLEVETFGLKLAEKQGVPAPRLLAAGEVSDKFLFRYLIMEFISGKLLSEIEKDLTREQKFLIGQNMRKITDKLNVPCENFTPFDVLQYALDNEEWPAEGFPESFLRERLKFLKSLHFSESEKVYCHGDLHAENILVDDDLNCYILDFADAMFAPPEYELLYVVSALFNFEKPYLQGFLGDYKTEDIVNLCMKWLPIHAWGHGETAEKLKPATEVFSFEIMRQRFKDLMK